MRAGTKAVFLRLSGCNLWNGTPEGRAKGQGACARWCDTDFAKGEALTAEQVLAVLEDRWPQGDDGQERDRRWVVITGGEPLLQLDIELLTALKIERWRVAVETNGTLDPIIPGTMQPILDSVDWLCISPKKGGAVKRTRGHELKVVLPGAAGEDEGWTEAELLALEEPPYKFEHRLVVPQDPVHMGQIGDTYLHPQQPRSYLAKDFMRHQQEALAWVMGHPRWRLGSQLHKMWQLP